MSAPPVAEPRASFEAMASFPALLAAARRAAQGKARSNDTCRFLLDVESQCLQLRRELLDGSYRPAAYRTFTVTDPKPRTISAAAFRDRVVHHALCAELEPFIERRVPAASFACRVGGGQRRALRAGQRLSQRWPYALRLDIEHFFETMSHAVLKRMLHPMVRHDARLSVVCSRFIDAGAPGSDPGRGVPIGNLTSQHFANLYLAALDRLIGCELRLAHVRYMDDLVVFGTDARTLWTAHARIDAFVRERLELRLKSSVTRVLPVAEGVSFLGFRAHPHLMPFDQVRKRRFVRRLRAAALQAARDPRAAQTSACSLVGWAQHGSTAALRRSLLSGRLREAD